MKYLERLNKYKFTQVQMDALLGFGGEILETVFERFDSRGEVPTGLQLYGECEKEQASPSSDLMKKKIAAQLPSVKEMVKHINQEEHRPHKPYFYGDHPHARFDFYHTGRRDKGTREGWCAYRMRLLSHSLEHVATDEARSKLEFEYAECVAESKDYNLSEFSLPHE